MTEPKTFLRNYDYDVCLAKGFAWTVAEAVDYLAAYLTNKESWYVTEDAKKAFPYIRYQVFSAVKQSLETGRLLICEEFEDGSDDRKGDVNCGIDFDKSTVSPLVFISWAIENNIEVPKQFARYAAIGKKDKADYFEGFGIKRTVIHHERCRALAELLWSVEPDIEIAQMAQRREIIDIGCEGHEYNMRTISRWLASMKADRRPGRSKKV